MRKLGASIFVLLASLEREFPTDAEKIIAELIEHGT